MPATDSAFLTAQRARARGFTIRLAAGVAVANLFVLSLMVLLLFQLRTQREERARITAQNLARVLEHDLDNLLDKTDITLLTVDDEVERRRRSGALGRHAMDAFLAAQCARVPELANLLVADASGDISHGADLSGRESVSVADRDFFTVHRDAPGSGLVVSRPFVGRLSRRWVIVIGRGLRAPDGTFRGVAWGVLPLDYLSKLFASVEIGPHGGISLRDGEMGIIARHPAPADLGRIIGNKVLSPELRARFEAGQTDGTFHTPTSWDGTAKVVSFRRIGRHPLYVNVGIATEDYLGGWRREVAWVSALAALFVLATLLLSFALLAGYRREKAVETSLHHLNAELEQRVQERTEELHARNSELENVVARVKQLEGIIPICMYCKKIRDDHDTWQQMEKYITDHSEAMFSHGICPACSRKLDLTPP